MLKTCIVMFIATLAVSVGEAFLSSGMKHIGDFSSGQIIPRLLQMFINPKVVAGVLLMGIFFFLYSATLSWADMSLVLPLSSMSFIFGAILAKYALHEDLSVWRWSGIAVIIIGVLMISRDPQINTTQDREEQGVPDPLQPPS